MAKQTKRTNPKRVTSFKTKTIELATFFNDQKLSAGSDDEYFAKTNVSTKKMHDVPRQHSAEDTDPKGTSFTINVRSMEYTPTNMSKPTAATKTKVADCEDELINQRTEDIEPKSVSPHPGHKG